MGARHPNHPGTLSTDQRICESHRTADEIHARARALDVLLEAEIPFIVGGAYAYFNYTGIYRDTKDLDLFLRRREAEAALSALAGDGWRVDRVEEEGWLFKGFKGDYFVDLIFSSGNGVAEVDDAWFENAREAEVFGRRVKLVPPEEMIWSKGFVLERERFDGADVCHLIKCVGPELDWRRLLERFDRYWEVLLAQLLLFRFAYPSERSHVPDWVMLELSSRTAESVRTGDWQQRICRGPLISRVNYAIDLGSWGYADGRAWDEAQRDEARRSSRDDETGLDAEGGGGRGSALQGT